MALDVPSLPGGQDHTSLRRRTVLRLAVTYLVPLLVLTVYFLLQYRWVTAEGQRLHLIAIAENQANTMDLFLSERLVNLRNLINDPALHPPPGASAVQAYLGTLTQNSDAFVDVGYFDPSGIQAAYAGPFPALEQRNYSQESWWKALHDSADDFIITDSYLGFRQRPHFTMAVRRVIDGQPVVLRATLDPERIHASISELAGSQEVFTSIVNRQGLYQMVNPRLGAPLSASPLVPAPVPRLGTGTATVAGTRVTYAYSWLRRADWALLVQWASEDGRGWFSGLGLRILGISVAIILLSFVIIVVRSRKVVEMQMESERTRAQLEHAAKLASVGELAAGIAHEINNPLAAINEEAGLMKDLLNPEWGGAVDPVEFNDHLDSIQQLVFRCRDITHKLLGFVRKHELELRPHDLHQLMDEVVDGLLGTELAVANIQVSRQYGNQVPRILTDGNQLQQVFLNIIKNAMDAMEDQPGRLSITTSRKDDLVCVTISDSGKGMSADQLAKIFLPFYTTKEVGKGTGLGLSVSYGIIKSLGGHIDVESQVGAGSRFSINLPVR